MREIFGMNSTEKWALEVRTARIHTVHVVLWEHARNLIPCRVNLREKTDSHWWFENLILNRSCGGKTLVKPLEGRQSSVQLHICPFPSYHIPWSVRKEATRTYRRGVRTQSFVFARRVSTGWHFGDLYHSSEVWNTIKAAKSRFGKAFFFPHCGHRTSVFEGKDHRQSFRYVDPLSLWGNSNLWCYFGYWSRWPGRKTLMESEVLIWSSWWSWGNHCHQRLVGRRPPCPTIHRTYRCFLILFFLVSSVIPTGNTKHPFSPRSRQVNTRQWARYSAEGAVVRGDDWSLFTSILSGTTSRAVYSA